jgi:alginate O-acetyltransferase complex protein AlgI
LALYISFFPQLVAGPIVRAADYLPQLRENRKVLFHLSAWTRKGRVFIYQIMKADDHLPTMKQDG